MSTRQRAPVPAAGAVPAAVAGALRAIPSPLCAYVYDRTALRANAARLRAALPPGTSLCYAVKANSHPEVVAALASAVDGLEVASAGELSLAQRCQRPGGLLVFGGPGKTDAALRQAVAAGAVIHVESVHELRRLALIAAADPVTVALRINREGPTPTGSHRMTGTATQFGMDEATMTAAIAVVASAPSLRLIGFGLHAVSNNLDAAAHAHYVADAVRWSVAASDRLGTTLRYVNAGGGLGVDYTGGGAFDLDVLRDGLAEATAVLPSGARLVLEPGRLLAASAGWYAAEVLEVKQTHGRWFAVLRGGTHHFRLPAAWGYSHPFTVVPVERWPYPFPRPEVRDAPVDVVGELCTPRDVLAREARVSRLRAGDIMVFSHAGAYGWDISHHDFLRHQHPQMIIV